MQQKSNGREQAGAYRNLALATFAFAACFFAWGMIAPLAPKLQDSLHLSDTQTSILIAMPVVLGSILRLPLGVATDRFRGHKVFGALIVFAATTGLLFGTAGSYALLLGAAFLLGAVGASFVVGVPFVAEWFPKERHGLVLGVYGMGNIGTAAASFTVPFVFSRFGQMAAGVFVSAAVTVAATAWILLARDAPMVEQPPPVRYREVLGYGVELWRLALFYFVSFGGFVALAVFLPKLLIDWFDFSLTDAGMRAAGFTVLATLSRPVGGMLADRIDARHVLAVAFAGIGLDAIGLVWQSPDPTIIPVTVFCLSMAVFCGIGSGAVFKLVPRRFPEATGAVTGIVGAAGGLGGFFPPLVLGVVEQTTGEYLLAFVFLVAFAWFCVGQTLAMAGESGSPPELTDL